MTLMVRVPVTVWVIVVIVMTIVLRIVASVIYRIGVAITGPDRYTKVTPSLRFLWHESDEAKGY